MPPKQAPPELIETVRRKLQSAFDPDSLAIEDESRKHARHREAAGRFHLAVRITSRHFEGLSAVARHRLVYEALAEELRGPLHALKVSAGVPSGPSGP